MNPAGLPNMQQRILLLEDLPEDTKLIEREVRKALPDYQLHMVTNRIDFEQALDSFAPDLILADYLLPQFRGDEALRLAQAQAPGIPFVFVTGTMNDEELAAQTILNGASGFVLKKNLWRLPQVITQALSLTSSQLEQEQYLRQLQEKIEQQRQEITQYQNNIAKMNHKLEKLQARLHSGHQRLENLKTGIDDEPD